MRMYCSFASMNLSCDKFQVITVVVFVGKRSGFGLCEILAKKVFFGGAKSLHLVSQTNKKEKKSD